jgi:hypothetical protein
MGGATGVVQLLLEAGADPAEQNGAGETALSLAVLVGQWECAEALLRSPGGARAVQVGALDGACLFCYPLVPCVMFGCPLSYTRLALP